MRTRLARTVCGALFLPLLVVSGSLRGEQAPAQSTLYAAYVLLAESPQGSTVAFARVIVDPDRSCPVLAGPGAERIAMTPRRNPHGFAVKARRPGEEARARMKAPGKLKKPPGAVSEGL